MTDLVTTDLADEVRFAALLGKTAGRGALAGYAADYLTKARELDALGLDKAVVAELLKVGPKGYEHGWIFVGVPGVGADVFHPHHGRGKVTRAGKRTVGVQFDSGHYAAFEHGLRGEHPRAGEAGNEHFAERIDRRKGPRKPKTETPPAAAPRSAPAKPSTPTTEQTHAHLMDLSAAHDTAGLKEHVAGLSDEQINAGLEHTRNLPVKERFRGEENVSADVHNTLAAERRRRRMAAGLTPSTRKPDPEGQLTPETQHATRQVRGAYDRALTRRGGKQGDWVGLADLREEMAADGMGRGEQDAALRQIVRSGQSQQLGFLLEEETNQKTLTPRDRAAAINVGQRDQHVVAFREPEAPREPRPERAYTSPWQHLEDAHAAIREGNHEQAVNHLLAAERAAPDQASRDRIAQMRRDLAGRVMGKPAETPKVPEPRSKTKPVDAAGVVASLGQARSRDAGAGRAEVTTAASVAAPEHPQKAVFDKLLGDSPGEGLVQHKQSRQIVEQMEAHGWKLTGQDRMMSITNWEAPDGRKMTVQFLTPSPSHRSDTKPQFYIGDRVTSPVPYKGALAHVVTPTHEEVSGPSVPGATRRVAPGLDEQVSHRLGIGDGPGRSDHTLDPLVTATRQLSGYGGTERKPLESVTGDLRRAAQQNRTIANQRADFNRRLLGSGTGEDSNSQRLRERADQFDRVASELERMSAERQAYEAERERRAGLPLDIRSTTRSGAATKPARRPKTSDAAARRAEAATARLEAGKPTVKAEAAFAGLLVKTAGGALAAYAAERLDEANTAGVDLAKFDPTEARDVTGRWSAGGSGTTTTTVTNRPEDRARARQQHQDVAAARTADANSRTAAAARLAGTKLPTPAKGAGAAEVKAARARYRIPSGKKLARLPKDQQQAAANILGATRDLARLRAAQAKAQAQLGAVLTELAATNLGPKTEAFLQHRRDAVQAKLADLGRQAAVSQRQLAAGRKAWHGRK